MPPNPDFNNSFGLGGGSSFGSSSLGPIASGVGLGAGRTGLGSGSGAGVGADAGENGIGSASGSQPTTLIPSLCENGFQFHFAQGGVGGSASGQGSST